MYIYIFFIGVRFATYTITPRAHSVKCPPQDLSPSHPLPPPTSPSTTPCSFPRVRSLSCFVSLSNFSHSFSLLPLIIPFSISYTPIPIYLYVINDLYFFPITYSDFLRTQFALKFTLSMVSLKACSVNLLNSVLLAMLHASINFHYL